MDRRTTPANGRVAAQSLKGAVSAERYVVGTLRQISVPLADLLREPHGRRDRQLLMGETVRRYESREGWAFVQAEKDNYVGYVRDNQLGEFSELTHWVSAAATHSYHEPDFKKRESVSLSLGARVAIIAEGDRFFETETGYIPAPHLSRLSERADDPVSVAEKLIHTPYLWGGNSRAGIDCSGLVQAACLACGIDCPGDSDMQARDLGRPLESSVTLARGDLVFWKGHVAFVSAPGQILHANAHSMSVCHESLAGATARIATAGDGGVIALRRLPRGKPVTK